MALLEDLVCPECGKEFQGVRTRNWGALCDTCVEIKESEAKESWLRGWRGKLSLEERVAKIEEWIFENKELAQPNWDGPLK